MKRISVLVLAAAAQLGGSALSAGDSGAKLLQRSAGQVQAAGWTGGQVKVPAAPSLGSQDAGPVSAEDGEEEDRSISSTVQVAEGAGADMDRKVFDVIVRPLNIRASAEGDIIRRVDIAGPPIRIMVVRRRPGTAAVDVVLAHGVRENGTLRMRFYATSANGTLTRVISKENGNPPQVIPTERAAESFRTEVQFWRDWEQEYQRRMMAGDK